MSNLIAGTMPADKTPIPRQIRYIIGNEGCERFSFYGMRNILTVFLVSSLLQYLPEADRVGAAKHVRFWRHGVPDVFLCRIRLCCRAQLRPRRQTLSHRGLLSKRAGVMGGFIEAAEAGRYGRLPGTSSALGVVPGSQNLITE